MKRSAKEQANQMYTIKKYLIKKLKALRQLFVSKSVFGMALQNPFIIWAFLSLMIFELWLQLFAIPVFGMIDGKKGLDYCLQFSIGHWLFGFY